MTGPRQPDEPQRQARAAGAGAPDGADTLATQAGLMRAIVATATEGIVTIDPHGRIGTINRAAERMFGYGPDELIGQPVETLMPSPYREDHAGYLRRYLETGKPHIIGIGREVLGRRRDGSVFPIDLAVGEGSVGDRAFFVAIIRDVTERKELQAALALAERLAAIGELAAGVAHEINNPVNTILNCAELLRDGEPLAEHVAMILDEGQRIARIVQDLLHFARDEQDPAQPTSVRDVVDRTLRLLQRAFVRGGIAIDVRIDDALPPVAAQTSRLQQVLLNLLLNARDAVLQAEQATPTVAIEARADRGGVTLSVRDNGPGVPAALGNRIFDPFMTTKRGRGGTGLGLSISKTIVEGYGGNIALHSAPGAGARFDVWLPTLGDAADDGDAT